MYLTIGQSDMLYFTHGFMFYHFLLLCFLKFNIFHCQDVVSDGCVVSVGSLDVVCNEFKEMLLDMLACMSLL